MDQLCVKESPLPSPRMVTSAAGLPAGRGCAPGTPPLAERPLLDLRQAGELAGLFKVLANDTRLRLLQELCRNGEVCVSDLAAAVGMRPQAVSNQLQRLVDRRILGTRRQGTSIFYRVVDPCVPSLLELGLCLMETPTTEA